MGTEKYIQVTEIAVISCVYVLRVQISSPLDKLTWKTKCKQCIAENVSRKHSMSLYQHHTCKCTVTHNNAGFTFYECNVPIKTFVEIVYSDISLNTETDFCCI